MLLRLGFLRNIIYSTKMVTISHDEGPYKFKLLSFCV